MQDKSDSIAFMHGLQDLTNCTAHLLIASASGVKCLTTGTWFVASAGMWHCVLPEKPVSQHIGQIPRQPLRL